MNEGVSRRAAQWVYSGIWGVLSGLLRVPTTPPELPVVAGDTVRKERLSEGWLRYRKFWFWLLLWIPDFAILVGWCAVYATEPWIAWVLLLPALAIAIVPDVVVYVGLHLQYDTTWYVFTPRSVRIRRGVWDIHEVTITYENVQNVSLSQGPVQRYFGIADVVIETAGGGSGRGSTKGERSSRGSHRGVLEGLSNAAEVRDAILDRARQSRSAGLGDDAGPDRHRLVGAWHAARLEALRHAAREAGKLTLLVSSRS